MSAIGISAARGKGFAVSAFADYRQDTLVFSRQQSLAMREMAWEGRVTPLMSWSDIILRVTAAAALVGALLAFVV